ncbi:MAG: TetR/AcrR family transcriptional regulator [Planctomycetota bacterium]
MARRPTKVERRRKILAAARKIFPRRGYAATPMADVASAAGVGKGTLYEYFRSKEDLFSTLVLSVIRESLETISDAGLAEDPATALRETIRRVIELALVENLDLYRLFFDFWGGSEAHRMETRKALRGCSADFRGLVSGILRLGQRSGAFRPEIDAVAFGHAFVAAIDGLSLQLVILGEKVDLKAYTAFLQEFLLAGALAPGPLEGASVLKEEK